MDNAGSKSKFGILGKKRMSKDNEEISKLNPGFYSPPE